MSSHKYLCNLDHWLLVYGGCNTWYKMSDEVTSSNLPRKPSLRLSIFSFILRKERSDPQFFFSAKLFTVLFMSFPLLFLERLPDFSNIYLVIVIALSCMFLVLLIVVGLLMWRLTRALANKREKTPEGGSSYEVEHPETPRDQHVSQGDGYLEPLKMMPPAISHYQSLHKNGTSAKYENVVINRGTDNGEEDELYLTIIPWAHIGWEVL